MGQVCEACPFLMWYILELMRRTIEERDEREKV